MEMEESDGENVVLQHGPKTKSAKKNKKKKKEKGTEKGQENAAEKPHDEETATGMSSEFDMKNELLLQALRDKGFLTTDMTTADLLNRLNAKSTTTEQPDPVVEAEVNSGQC